MPHGFTAVVISGTTDGEVTAWRRIDPRKQQKTRNSPRICAGGRPRGRPYRKQPSQRFEELRVEIVLGEGLLFPLEDRGEK